MGLDMFLRKAKAIDSIELWKDKTVTNIKLWELDPYVLKKDRKRLYDKLLPYLNKDTSYETYSQEIAYWRKANQIHSWFVENVQGGEDNCECYPVSQDNLTELLDRCKEVLTCFNGGKIKYGKAKRVAALLPTQEGFFFGSTEYDDSYVRDLEQTVEILNPILNGDVVNWDDEVVVYHSSW